MRRPSGFFSTVAAAAFSGSCFGALPGQPVARSAASAVGAHVECHRAIG